MRNYYQIIGIDRNGKRWIKGSVSKYRLAEEIARQAEESKLYKQVRIVAQTPFPNQPFSEGATEKLAQIEEQKLQQGGDDV